MQESAFGPIRQIGYVVRNIDTAIAQWHRQTGIGPFAVVRDVNPFGGSTYRGEPAGDVAIDLAFAYIGDIQLELIEQLDDNPFIYREALEQPVGGLHHYGVCVDDYDAAYRFAMESGFRPVVNAGAADSGRMAYVESDLIEGLIFELIEWTDATSRYFDDTRAFLDAADDSQLVHTFSF